MTALNTVDDPTTTGLHHFSGSSQFSSIMFFDGEGLSANQTLPTTVSFEQRILYCCL